MKIRIEVDFNFDKLKQLAGWLVKNYKIVTIVLAIIMVALMIIDTFLK